MKSLATPAHKLDASDVWHENDTNTVEVLESPISEIAEWAFVDPDAFDSAWIETRTEPVELEAMR